VKQVGALNFGYSTNDVFGVRSKLIASYIEREKVDELFNDALRHGNEIIVYGSSKQGKTSLLLKNLREEQFVKVECSPQTEPIDIYKSILRQLGIAFVESETAEASYEHGGKIGGGFKIKIPVIGEAGFKAEVADKASSGTSQVTRYIEYNLALAQDVAEILKANKINKYLVLENFHYLPTEVQGTLAFDLRAFQDQGVIFIILGIWREANRLIQFNGDLLDRITEVPVEPWDAADFKRVIQKGALLLNVDFSQVENDLVNAAFDSIGVVQELCKNACLAAGVDSTVKDKVDITSVHLAEAIRRKADEYGVRHIRNFESFSDVVRKTSNQSGKPSLAFPYYFIRVLLTTDFQALEQGISRGALLEEMRKIHHRPEDVRSTDLGAFLHNITQHQINKKIQPPFVDYDRGGKIMKIIDSSLYFFLKHCDRQQILDDLPDPLQASDP
jgi:hypothetical protein